ncbi:MAG: hypothetical protein KDK23_07010 [Leptospiraceae bacterium]|nr:hypothetical protein [Leptospiraceae bacterium]
MRPSRVLHFKPFAPLRPDRLLKKAGIPAWLFTKFAVADGLASESWTGSTDAPGSPRKSRGKDFRSALWQGRLRYPILALTLLLFVLPGHKGRGEPIPSDGRTRITIMATSDFAGSFELNKEGSRGWSVLRTYARQVKFNRRNAASTAYLFHTGDLSGLEFDTHDFPNGSAYFDAAHPMGDTESRTAQLLIRRGADLLEYAGFDGVALRSTEEKDLQKSSDTSWTSLLRFRPSQPDWTTAASQPGPSHSFRILTGARTFVWVSAVEPAGDMDSLNVQIRSLRREIYNNRAANLIVLLFATHKKEGSHDDPDAFQRLSPEQFLTAFLNKENGNLFHPLSADESAGPDFPYRKILFLMPGHRAFFQTPEGSTICRIPSGQLCQMEFDFRNNRKSVSQHWVGFDEATRNHSFIPADPGMEKILRQR